MPRPFTTLLIPVLLGLLLVGRALTPAPCAAKGGDDELAAAWKETLNAARAALDTTWTSLEHGTGTCEEYFVWSERVLEAELATGVQAGPAHGAHVQRMERLLDDQRQREEAEAASPRAVAQAVYFLARARAGQLKAR